jgi:hypothetical protein
LAIGSAGLFAGGVSVDYKMVETGIDWLELIRSGAGDKEIKRFFMEKVAPTGGCQSIIHHWARFKKWDEELLYAFILEGLGRIPATGKLKNDDGTPTMLGRRRELWQKALNDIDGLKQRLKTLKQSRFVDNAVRLATENLPAEAKVGADFYFVLFGHSTAYSVGQENGYDFLQLPQTKNGTLDIRQLTETFAHELHHTGFSYLADKIPGTFENGERIMLAGILAGEGMPTHFVDQRGKRLQEFENHHNPLYRMVASDWKKHSARIPQLLKKAQQDIALNLEGKLDQAAIMKDWMGGVTGPAYVLGSYLFQTIHHHLGKKAAIAVATDYRTILQVYNKAVDKGKDREPNLFKFDSSLAQKLADFNNKTQ